MLFPRRFMHVLAALYSVLLVTGCSPTNDTSSPLAGSGDETPANLPFNKIIERPFPAARLDCFYKTKIDRGGKKEFLDDRLISNGKGFVAYSVDPKFVDNGYYLFNFYGRSSFFVNLMDRTYKVALQSPADDILLAYQDGSDSRLPPGYRSALPGKKIGVYGCRGFSYKKGDTTREEWFDTNTLALVKQTIVRPDEQIERVMQRHNTNCETALLRLPGGFTLIK